MSFLTKGALCGLISGLALGIYVFTYFFRYVPNFYKWIDFILLFVLAIVVINIFLGNFINLLDKSFRVSRTLKIFVPSLIIGIIWGFILPGFNRILTIFYSVLIWSLFVFLYLKLQKK
ncbi:hypothetical protein DRN73_09615 [Candidatus Pacearchaeota archaeon]|nr:MAG: hypothetical protein DRN73_09615 [Candidatus Pacearchaeota archaeon]